MAILGVFPEALTDDRTGLGRSTNRRTCTNREERHGGEEGELDLGSIWLFSACPARQLRTIRRAVEEIEVPAGVVLCEEGSVGREFFYIVDGTATVKHNGRRVTSLGPGRYFGELSLLDRRPRNATIVSETPMKLWCWSSEASTGCSTPHPGCRHKLLVAMAERLREADKTLVQLTRRPPVPEFSSPSDLERRQLLGAHRRLHHLRDVEHLHVVLALTGPARRRRA